MARSRLAAGVVFALGLSQLPAAAQLLPRAVAMEDRTADMPDSWLVLYNATDIDSTTWAAWYCEQWGIPAGNAIGLTTSTAEHLADKSAAQSQIISPVRSLLDANPELEARTMGIIVGYRVAGHYATPVPGGPGGYSIPDALEDMYDDDKPAGPCGSYGGQQGYNDHDNPQLVVPPSMLPTLGRPTKAWMEPRRYMVARIDGPTLADAMALTLRAKYISNGNHYVHGETVWFDYKDSVLPGGKWTWLKRAVEKAELAEIPWMEFDEDTQQTPNDSIRFGAHDVDGWNDSRLFSHIEGSRILAFDYNSWGVTTVRSTTADNARFVPNALAAGYAAAIGSTCEPACCCNGPCPETLFAALREGWTLGESFHIADMYDDWVWTLVGDPLLRMPHWFDEPRPPATGDMNGDGLIDGRDIGPFVRVITGLETDPDVVALADLNGDSVVNDDDVFLLGAPTLYQTNDPNVLRGSGDANGDQHVDGRDIAAFVDKLLSGLQGDEPLREQYGPDMNKDGQITMDDVPLFIAVLSQR